jgi:hypothetical protein
VLSSRSVTKENTERWTRQRAFAQVRHSSNIQLLPYSLVNALATRSASQSVLIMAAFCVLSTMVEEVYRLGLTVLSSYPTAPAALGWTGACCSWSAEGLAGR